MTFRVPVCAMPLLDPAVGRINIDLPAGLNVAQIIAEVLPAATEEMLDRARVWLVSNLGEMLLSEREHWGRIRPRPGVRVMIRLVPGDTDLLRSTLMIAVSIGATALGQFWAGPAILQATGNAFLANIGGALLGAGVAIAGATLVNWMIPAANEGGDREKPTYTISGWQNRANPDGPVPSIVGRHRIAPVFAAPSYSEIVGDQHFIRALFLVGYGQYEISDLRIKETPIGNYEDVEYQVRDGSNGDAVTLYPQQVIEENVGAELRRDRLRDENGDPIGIGPTSPVVRLTAGDTAEANVILSFPTGLGRAGDTGEIENHTVNIRIRQRASAGGSWQEVITLSVTASQREPFFRQHRWTLPSRGRWEIEVTRLTSEPTNPRINERTAWATLQSFRPEYPINFGKRVAVVAVRIRATFQLNGNLDSLNLLAQRVIPDFDMGTGTWVMRKTRNPASIFRHVLQGAESAFPEPDNALDLAQLEDWHNFCRLKGLKYDRIHDFEASLWDVLTDVARAGRASPRHDGRKWGVVIDRPSNLVVAHVNPRNSRDFTWSRNYIEPPHAFRVEFLDETSDYQTRERIVRWPGHVGDITLTEALQLPGKTDPAEIWRETRRRQYEIIHRPDQFRAVQDGAVRTATRGDLVKGSYDTLDRTLFAHRVTAVRGQLITLDGWVGMEAGQSYAVRFFRQSGSGEAATFTSTVRNVVRQLGEHDSIALDGDGFVPAVGEIVQFGVAGQESLHLMVAGTEAGEGMTSVLTMLAAAPIVDQLTDAEVAPAWDGRVGTEQGPDVTPPKIPQVLSIQTHYEVEGDADGLTVLLGPGAAETALIGSYSLRHRLAGQTAWSLPLQVAAAEGAIVVLGYTAGQSVEMQRLATSRAGYSSNWSATFSKTLEAPADAPLPVPGATITAGLGSASIQFATPTGGNLSRVNIYRGPTADAFAASLVASIPVLASSSYGHVDGDNTRPNLLINGRFDADTDWSKGTGWAIAGGKATKSGASATSVSQPKAVTPGSVYRYAFTVSDRTGGTLTARFTGGTTVVGGAAQSNATFMGSLTATTGNDTFHLYGTAAFVGSVDDAVLYEQSSTSVPQGTHYYFLRSANAEGREAAPYPLGPITII